MGWDAGKKGRNRVAGLPAGQLPVVIEQSVCVSLLSNTRQMNRSKDGSARSNCREALRLLPKRILVLSLFIHCPHPLRSVQ